MTDDELERRKEETWGMSEIRGDSLAEEDTEISSPEEDTSEASDTTDTAEGKATAESDVASDIATSRNPESVSNTMDTTQSKNTADTKDISDTPDSADQKGTSDQSASQEISDTSDSDGGSTSKEQTKGNTVREMALDAEAKGLAVRDLHNVNVYLYEDIHQEMISTFKALDAEYYQTYGEDLSKNKDFFNAVFRAGLTSPRLREELELEE
jgi:hypothetical protein